MRPDRGRALVAAFGWVVLPVSVLAQEAAPGPGTLSQKLELTSHQALIRLIDDPRNSLAPFETDGCSGGLSQTWKSVADQVDRFSENFTDTPPWEHCCVIHDRAYHMAGGATDAAESYAARLNADTRLRACVIETGQADVKALAATYRTTPEAVARTFATIAGAMYLAVRFGGAPCSGLSWRWGFGYPDCSIWGVPD
jgi:hypothetical protein